MTELQEPPRADIFVPHAFPEHRVDLGEIHMNYATTGSPERPALLLVPPQTQSWWTYERAMPLLAEQFQVFAVDLRGQGRSTRTPGRYTLDNMGNDLVRFIDLVIDRPAVISGNSSGGVLAAWARAFWSGTASASCDHERMLSSVRAPMLVTHHFRALDPDTGSLMGAVSDQQVRRAGQLVANAGQRFEVRDFPQMAHSMHAHDPELFARTLVEWSHTLAAPEPSQTAVTR